MPAKMYYGFIINNFWGFVLFDFFPCGNTSDIFKYIF